MRLLFYFRTHFDDPSNIGVIEKCRSIVAAFAANGTPTDTFYFSEKGLEKAGSGAPVLSWPNRKHGLRHRMLYFLLSNKWLKENIDFQAYTHVYIRHLPADPSFLDFLKTAKQQHPELQILIELPTWPYDEESRGFANRMVVLLDRYYRQCLQRYTDYVLHYGTEQTVMGIPAIPLSNGVDWRNIPLRSVTQAPENTLRMIAVSNWNTWHGLDRVLQGIKKYRENKGKTIILLNVVGNGPAMPALKKMVRELQLEGVVQFHPPASGEALHRLFDQADVAIGVLGLHRKGLRLASPLKHREYCARGIPFLMAGKDSDFDTDWLYALPLPEDDTPVNMEQVLAFARTFTAADFRAMRAFAEQHLGWEIKTKAISDRYAESFYPGV